MNTLKTALFENPTYIYIGLAFVFIILLAIWHEKRSKQWLLISLIPLVLAGLVFLLPMLVKTDREQIVLAVKEIAVDVEAGSADKGAFYLDESYRGFHGSKPALVMFADLAIKRYKIGNVRIQKLKVDVEDSRAKSRIVTILDFAAEGMEGKTSIIWNLHWIKREDGWRIIEIEEPQEGLELM